MARQRSKIDRLTYELRELVCSRLFDGDTYVEIQAALAAAGVKPEDMPGLNAFTSYKDYPAIKGGEYQIYAAQRRKYNTDLQTRRWASSVVNEGKGAQSVADLAELAILEQLHSLAQGGLLETGKDVATVAKAITAMQRTQLARADAGLREEIEKIKKAWTVAIEDKDIIIAELRAEIAALKGGGKVDLAKVADNMERLLGGSK